MTKQNFNKSSKFKSIIALVLLFLLSFTLFFISACDETTTEDDTIYKKIESDDSDIVNGSFEFGTSDLAISDFPQTSSLTGWNSVSTEYASPTSSIPSGIISTKVEKYSTDEEKGKETVNNFRDVIDKLYDNNTSFKSKAATIFNIDTTGLTDDQIKLEIAKKNPGVHTGAAEQGKYKVYMLNAYSSEVFNTAQTTASSSSITLEKGEYAKISFWVYKLYVNGNDQNSDDSFQINFRLNNSFNSTTLPQYVLTNIGVAGEWTQYTIYLKGDANYSSTFTPVMSIGYSSANKLTQHYCEGTAFFDDIVYETIEEANLPADFATFPTKPMKFGSKDKVLTQSSTGSTEFVYDMTFDTPVGYFNDADIFVKGDTVNVDLTYSKGKNSAQKFPGEATQAAELNDKLSCDNNNIKLENIKYSSVSVTIKDNTHLVVAPESYMLLSFDVVNSLDKKGSTLITFYVYDQDENENSTITVTDTEEVTHSGLAIINNDPDNERTFYIVIVIGPTSVDESVSKNDFASGTVEIQNISYATGLAYRYKKLNGEIIYPQEETENYSYYSFFSTNFHNVKIDDYTKESSDTYYIAAAKSYGDNDGNKSIRYYPVAAETFRGVSYNSNYVKPNGDDNDINTRIGQGDADGNYAGLINSNFDYDTDNDIAAIDIIGNLNYNRDYRDKSIQPLMIYNNSADSYGFIGDSFNISASSYAAISVKVRVIGNAKAYVYLVNTNEPTKTIYEMNFTGNVKNNYYKEEFTAPLAFEVGETDWTVLTFYIATGKTELNLRLELWNGSRDGENKSEGFVFFAFDAFDEDETFTPSTLTSAFTEPATATAALSTSGNPLYDNAITDGIEYKRELDSREIKFNGEYPDEAVSYNANYVWAKTDNVIYAVYNTIDPVAVNPYDNKKSDSGSSCKAQTDPSSFWLSFSSILLASVLVLAIFMLVVKNVRRKRKANKSDAKSHYNVTSRHRKNKNSARKVKAKKAFAGYEDEVKPDDIVKVDEQTVVEAEEQTETTDEYVYGDVQDFGSDIEKSDENITDETATDNNATDENSDKPE